MIHPATVLAHLVKLGVSASCLKQLPGGFSVYGSYQAWAVKAFQILLFHSLLGVLRFGTPDSNKFLRSLYTWFTTIANVIPFIFFTTEILHECGVSKEVRLILLTLGCLPTIYELALKERACPYWMDIVVSLQLLALTFASVQSGLFGVISLTASYAFTHYFLEDFCDKYDVPYMDLLQYNLCFLEIFAMLILKEL
ncbi:uncharacterized protein LOC107274342 [Cephus cinctus]|uniref:Uncharacterized protein LOC107274342 n=1 Tax=Cephus cinctus TaxID=211228 RepID=A0AAJ7CG14_CEPCN|nr:uncharacterized protein LOC107274342 [Cephus cinctus]